MKRKKKNKKGKYCYIYMTDAEIELYGPEHYPTRLDAIIEFQADCMDIAEHYGYTTDDIFMPGIELLKERINKLWESTKSSEKL